MMQNEKTYDECYFLNYDVCNDLQLYEIGRQACPPGYSYGPIIREHYIFHYLLSGEGTLYLNEQKYELHAHQGFIIPQNALAQYVASEENPWDYIWVHLDGPKTMEFFERAGMNVKQPIFTPICYPNAIEDIMQELLENNTRELYCVGKIFELFELIIKLSNTRNPSNVNTKLAYMKTITNYVHIKYSEPIGMEDIARACGLNRSYMTRLFKNTTGRTPQEYLTSYRMKKAEKMLLDTESSVQSIAYTVGYGDSFSFSKAFKRFSGKSPRDYREENVTNRHE